MEIIICCILCGVLAGLFFYLVKEKKKNEFYMELTKNQEKLINDLQKDFEDVNRQITEMELMPCHTLIFTAYFNQENPWQIVDISKYEDSGIIGVTVGLVREPNEREKMIQMPGRAIPIPVGAICKIGDKIIWDIM